MGSVSSEDELGRPSERFELDNYSLSADVSESEGSSSSGSFSCGRRHYDRDGISTSPTDYSPIAVTPPVVRGLHAVVPANRREKLETDELLSEVDLMKERFAKLLLGEDMSGGGKGVCTALAISNAITNLSASVFGEMWKLEPLKPEKKLMWHREMEWLLCVSDSIVELVPSTQDFPGGGTFEVMMPRQRLDLHTNLPALKKLNAMLLSILDGFCNSEFYYIDRGVLFAGHSNAATSPLSSSSGRPSIRLEEKWWLPFPKVPPNGLSDGSRKRLQQCRECTNQILKAAMAINSSVLAEMEVPKAYLESLPKNAKACLGEVIHHYMTAKQFSPDSLLDYLDLSSEYTTLEIANKIEAAAYIWGQKCQKTHLVHSKDGTSSWGGKVKGFISELQKSKLLTKRAETLLHNLRLRFPSLPQTALDTSKIQYNRDVGHAIIESYSRVMESLASNIMARIDDLLQVDDATKQQLAAAELSNLCDHGRFGSALRKQKQMPPSNFSFQYSPRSSPCRIQTFSSSSDIAGKTHHKAIPGTQWIRH